MKIRQSSVERELIKRGYEFPIYVVTQESNARLNTALWTLGEKMAKLAK